MNTKLEYLIDLIHKRLKGKLKDKYILLKLLSRKGVKIISLNWLTLICL